MARKTGSRLFSAAIKRFMVEDVGSLGLCNDFALAMQANVAIIGALNREIEHLGRAC